MIQKTLFLFFTLLLLSVTYAQMHDQQMMYEQMQAQQMQAQQMQGGSTCDISIVGTGFSGVYTAYRLATAEDSPVEPSNICLFDALDRSGGRILTWVDEKTNEHHDMGLLYYSTGFMPWSTALFETMGLETECAFRADHGVSGSGMEKRQSKGIKDTQQQEVKVEEAQVQDQQQEIQLEEAQSFDEQQIKDQQTQVFQTQQAVTEECKTISIDFWNLRNVLIRKNMTDFPEMLPYNFEKTDRWNQIRDLFETAVKAVFGDEIDLDDIKHDTDATSRWNKVKSIIDRIRDGDDITYKGVELHRLSALMVLSDYLDLSTDEFRAALDLQEMPALRTILTYNFEHFLINYFRILALGFGEARTFTDIRGMYTPIDEMLKRLAELGVQIYYESELTDINVMSPEAIALEFNNMGTPVMTSHLILALNARRLNDLIQSTQGLSQLTPEASLSFGSLLSHHLVKGVVFYKTAWWKELGLSGWSKNDGPFEFITYFDDEGCEEKQSCALEIYSFDDALHRSRMVDIENPIEISTVLDLTDREQSKRDELLLDLVHNEIVRVHDKLEGFSNLEIEKPDRIIWANWASDSYFDFGSKAGPSDIHVRNFVASLLSPLPGFRINFLNSDYSEIVGDPESSIIQSERLLHNYFQMEKPEWIENSDLYDHLTDIGMETEMPLGLEQMGFEQDLEQGQELQFEQGQAQGLEDLGQEQEVSGQEQAQAQELEDLGQEQEVSGQEQVSVQEQGQAQELEDLGQEQQISGQEQGQELQFEQGQAQGIEDLGQEQQISGQEQGN